MASRNTLARILALGPAASVRSDAERRLSPYPARRRPGASDRGRVDARPDRIPERFLQPRRAQPPARSARQLRQMRRRVAKPTGRSPVLWTARDKQSSAASCVSSVISTPWRVACSDRPASNWGRAVTVGTRVAVEQRAALGGGGFAISREIREASFGCAVAPEKGTFRSFAGKTRPISLLAIEAGPFPDVAGRSTDWQSRLSRSTDPEARLARTLRRFLRFRPSSWVCVAI